MFSSLLNTAKEALSAAADDHSATNPHQANTTPQQPAQPAHGAQGGNSGGGDILSGLLQTVGKTLSEGNHSPAQQNAPPAGSATQSKPAQGGPQLSQDDIAMISKGLGAIVQVIQQKASTKDVQEEAATKMDSNDGKTQVSSTTAADGNAPKPEQGGDFWSGLMNTVKDVSKVINEQQDGAHGNTQAPQGAAAHSGPQLSQEDIARITDGLGSLVGTIKDRTIGSKVVEEEQVTMLDSQGGKVQVSSVVEKDDTKATSQSSEQAASSGGDFFSGFMSVAKDVGKAIGEPKQTGNTAGTTATQAPGGIQLSQEDIAKITAGLGSLVGNLKDKAFTKTAATEEVTATVSKDGKVLTSSAVEKSETLEAVQGGGDFLSGLLSVAKDVGKTISDQSQSGASTGHTGGSAQSQPAPQLSQDDIARITAGLGSLVGNLGGKATGIFGKTTPAEEKEKEAKEEPVIDDVEEEVSKVIISGYRTNTAAMQKKSD